MNCECYDPGCNAHRGSDTCKTQGVTILYRIDMEDETGSLMCEACCEDAMECGLFVAKD